MNRNKKIETIKKIIYIIVIISFIFLVRKKMIYAYDFVVENVNFRLVKYKDNLYQSAINFRTKVDMVSNSDKYIENIKDLQKKVEEKEFVENKARALEIENLNLRSTLELKQFLNLDTIACEVKFSGIKDDDTLYLSKGSDDRIRLNQVVVYNGNMIGKITKLDKNCSEVTLLTSKDSKVGVIINNEYLCILRGNGNGTFSVKNYNTDIDINGNNSFEIKTSGVSDIIPKDIMIGNYYLKNKEQFKQTKELIFEPTYKYANIRIVLVVKGVK